MADVTAAVPVPAGSLSRLARVQYRALAAVRWRMLVNGLRTNDGVFELGARAIGLLIYAGMGIGLGVGAGAATYSMLADRTWALLPIQFWVVWFLWQSVSVALASFQEQFELAGLLRFPVSFRAFYFLCLLFGLLDASTVLGGFCAAGILTGALLARPQITVWALAALALFCAFNVLLVRAILAWVDRWLAKRRSREIVSAIFLLAMVGLQFLNPAMRERDDLAERKRPEMSAQTEQQWKRWALETDKVQAWLPPGLAAKTLEQASLHEPTEALGSLTLLGVWCLAIGGLLGVRLRAEYRGESLGESARRAKRVEQKEGWRLGGSGPVWAVVEKDLRTLTRSIPQLYAVFVPMLMVFLFGTVFRHGGGGSSRFALFALPICVAYGLLGFTQLIYNNLGMEGAGIQSLFLFPVSLRTVMMAKNLLSGVLYLLVALLSAVLACLRIGPPTPAMAALTVAWVLFALPASLAAGNLLSVTMAYRVNLGRLGRQSGSQANSLLSMLIQMTLLGIGSAVIGLAALFELEWFAVAVLLALALVAAFVWVEILRRVDGMALARRDVLIAKMTKAE